MSDLAGGHHYAGAAKREAPLLDEANLGPWRGRVRVIPIAGIRSRAGTVQFEVRAEWIGPGLPGLPPSSEPVEASDVWCTADVEQARSIALRAVAELRDARVPDLGKLARRAGAA
jgi:hypothetical protein